MSNMTDAEKITALRAERVKLRQCRVDLIKAFNRYGRHDSDCYSQLEGRSKLCNCGYEAASATVQFWKKPILKKQDEGES